MAPTNKHKEGDSMKLKLLALSLAAAGAAMALPAAHADGVLARGNTAKMLSVGGTQVRLLSGDSLGGDLGDRGLRLSVKHDVADSNQALPGLDGNRLAPPANAGGLSDALPDDAQRLGVRVLLNDFDFRSTNGDALRSAMDPGGRVSVFSTGIIPGSAQPERLGGRLLLDGKTFFKDDGEALRFGSLTSQRLSLFTTGIVPR